MRLPVLALVGSLAGSYGSEGANARGPSPSAVEGPEPDAPARVVAAPATEQSPRRIATVGVEWAENDENDDVLDALRDELRRVIARRQGIEVEQIVEQPLAVARLVIAREVPRETVPAQLRQVERLAAARQAFREARFAAARSEIAAVFTSIAEQPEVAGAAARAREAHVLDAQIAWASGARVEADAALRGALALDPEATLSTRRVPPELAARYAELQAELLATRPSWAELEISLPADLVDPALEVEIDGVVGRRPVPAGVHLVVVRRPGHRPQARSMSAGEAWALANPAPELGTSFPESAVDAQRICEALGLDELVLADQRGGEGVAGRRVGLQVFHCGERFGPRWIGETEALGSGLARASAGSFRVVQASVSLAWPELRAPQVVDDRPVVVRRPWYRRAWVWVLIGGAVAAGVTTGVVLGTREQGGGVSVDGGQFSGE